MAAQTNVVMICNINAGSKDAEETVHALRYAAIARDVVTGSAIAMSAQRTTRFVNSSFGGRAKFQHGQPRKASARLASVPESAAAPADQSAAAANGGQSLKCQEEMLEEMEQEIRNELAEEMEATIEVMEQSYRDKLARETAIHESKFEHKLKLLKVFEEKIAHKPEELVGMLEELERLRGENVALRLMREQHAESTAQVSRLEQQGQAAQRELTAMRDRSTAEQEESRGALSFVSSQKSHLRHAYRTPCTAQHTNTTRARSTHARHCGWARRGSWATSGLSVQCEANLAMEMETLEFQLDQSTREGDRLREEVSSLTTNYAEVRIHRAVTKHLASISS